LRIRQFLPSTYGRWGAYTFLRQDKANFVRESLHSSSIGLRIVFAPHEGIELIWRGGDAAISGASVILRPGVQCSSRTPSVADSTLCSSRLWTASRDQADVATLLKHLRFAVGQIG
jgi:hypothetical protein